MRINDSWKNWFGSHLIDRKSILTRNLHPDNLLSQLLEDCLKFSPRNTPVLFVSTLQAANQKNRQNNLHNWWWILFIPFLKNKEKFPLPHKKTINQIQKLIQPDETLNVLSITANLQQTPPWLVIFDNCSIQIFHIPKGMSFELRLCLS